MRSLSDISPRGMSGSSPTTTSRATWRSAINCAASLSDAEPRMVTGRLGHDISSQHSVRVGRPARGRPVGEQIGLADDADQTPSESTTGRPPMS